MHKATTIVALVVVLTVVVAGVAVAVTETCTTVPCRGTSSADVLKERIGNGKHDVIFGGRGGDRLRASRFTNDTDELHGGRGNDRIIVLDGDFRDSAAGGLGNNDVCFVDDQRELSSGCEVFAVP